jgi:hypothetical protein
MAKRSKADVNRAIDLLWSHQIRRENAALHGEVKRLQQQALSQADEAREWHTVSGKAQEAAAAATACLERVLTDQKTLQTAVEIANRQAQNATEQISILQISLQDARASETQLITHYNKDMSKLRAELSRFQDQSKLDINQMGTALHHIMTKLDEKQSEVDLRRLHDRVSQLEASLLERPNLDSLSRIENSIEEQYCDDHGDGRSPHKLVSL